MQDELSRAQWKKSSYSGNSGNCVEVVDLGQAVAVRDSKNPRGAVLVVDRRGWRRLLFDLKNSR